MYDDLSEEETISLAIEFVSQGVSLPEGLRNKLDASVIEDIEAAKE